MGAMEDIKKETEDRMHKTIDSLKKDLTKIRTGRATPALLDGITVDYYGNPAPINQVANISVPDARMLVVQPWEKSMIKEIEKAVQASNLGLNPQSDGNQIRLPIPPLSEERRKELFKGCGKIGEECKVALRNVRRDSNDKLKKAQKDKLVTEDQEKKGLDDVQKVTDKYIKMVDEQLALKEKEIMEV
ncbi:MAG: ribosome recycling factor [Chitinispirillia bacterium]|nr:ribosome recycling factor [Chitinispirillia bacterium]MCL2241130.1 ribosome recycling factor [Chitinispirillia bacterium]